jgi:hypothetical protein
MIQNNGWKWSGGNPARHVFHIVRDDRGGIYSCMIITPDMTFQGVDAAAVKSKNTTLDRDNGGTESM